MSLYDMIFGSDAESGLFGADTNQTGQLVNQAFNQAYNNYQAQAQLGQQQAFNQKMMNWNTNPFANASPHKWVFNNRPCTLQEFADAIWGQEEHEDKMLFILTHSGPKVD